MYTLLCRSAERPWDSEPVQLDCPPETGAPKPLILHMQENRSQLTQPERLAITAVSTMIMITSLLPALKGFWVTPLFTLLAFGGLVVALERHGRSRPVQERLEFDAGEVRLTDRHGRQFELPACWTRFAPEGRSPTDLRLFLRGGGEAFEFGRCLSLMERRAVVPLVAAALARSKGAMALPQPW